MGRKCPECQRYLGVIENLTAALTGQRTSLPKAVVHPAPVQAEQRALETDRQTFEDTFVREFAKGGITEAQAREEARRLSAELYATFPSEGH